MAATLAETVFMSIASARRSSSASSWLPCTSGAGAWPWCAGAVALRSIAGTTAPSTLQKALAAPARPTVPFQHLSRKGYRQCWGAAVLVCWRSQPHL